MTRQSTAPLFADDALAAGIDRAEGRLCADFAASIQARRGAGTTFVAEVCGGLAIYAGPSSPVNKVIGLGFDGPLDDYCLEAIEERWRERGEPVRIELSVLAHPSTGGTLTGRGYRLHGFENVLGRRLDHSRHETYPCTVTVELLDERDSPTWIDIAVNAFLNLDGTGSVAPDPLSREHLEQLLGDVATVSGLRRYLARVDGQPVGEAAARFDGTIAQLAGSGTLPAFRGRGVQKALVQQRLVDAADAGCSLAVVTTAPGSRSQDNVMRRGFELLYARAILIKDINE